jgi:hypothetical protein
MCPRVKSGKLYDLQKDPREMNSVYSNPEYESEVQRLKEQLGELREQYGVEEIPQKGDPRNEELRLRQQKNRERAERGLKALTLDSPSQP